jgi:toxin-antitoxin system PIN domain toxin
VLVVDANVLLYAVNSDGAHHRAARDWFDRALGGSEAVGLAWTVILAFLRLGTNPTVFPHPLDAADAIRVVRGWLRSPVVLTLEPGDRHLAILDGLLGEAGSAGNLVTDAHLAALAIEHDATLVSYDADFSRFEGLRWQRPG